MATNIRQLFLRTTVLLLCLYVVVKLSAMKHFRFGTHLSYDTPGMTRSCELKSAAKHNMALARFIIFQRDTGFALERAVSHYASVVDYDSIVIIDHRGEDSLTANILERFASLGAHVWRCDGRWIQKAVMWSDVTGVYAPASQFVFPVDVDELYAIKGRTDNTLRWDRAALFATLARLGNDGRAFKSELSLVVPPECSPVFVSKQGRGKRHDGDFCRVRSVRPADVNCMSKCFARGSDFHSTDHGNHRMRTHANRILFNSNGPECTADILEKLFYVDTDFVLVHVQQLNFGDWLLHSLRGASDYGYNSLPLRSKCPEMGRHYCEEFQHALFQNFSFYELRKTYRSQLCAQAEKAYLFENIALQHC